MDQVYIPALVTFTLVLGFLAWNRQSVKRNQIYSDQATWVCDPNDPLS